MVQQIYTNGIMKAMMCFYNNITDYNVEDSRTHYKGLYGLEDQEREKE